MGVDAGAHGGAPQGQLAQGLQDILQTADGMFNHGGVAAELLAQADGRGVHQVGAADLDDVIEGLGLFRQGVPQPPEGGQQVVGQAFQGGDVHGRGDDVVAGLAHVDVVVGMNGAPGAQGAAQNLVGPVGDDLVGVHVGGRAGPGLENVQGEVVVQAPVDDLLAGLDDGL